MRIDEIKTKFADVLAQAQAKPRGSRRFPDSFKKAIVEAMAEGTTATEIITAFNLHYSTLMAWKSGAKRFLRTPKKHDTKSGFNEIRVIEEKNCNNKKALLRIETPSGIVISIG